jgi:hypothetical protein
MAIYADFYERCPKKVQKQNTHPILPVSIWATMKYYERRLFPLSKISWKLLKIKKILSVMCIFFVEILLADEEERWKIVCTRIMNV